MKYIYLIFFLLLLVPQALKAQYTSEKELIAKIRSYKTDASLDAFLQKEKLIPDDTIPHFHVASLKIDIFKRNLFGAVENELTIQLRDTGAYAVSFYYYDLGKLKKVPGLRHTYFSEFGAFLAQEYSFSYENIFRENEYAVLIRDYSEYNRTVSETFTLVKIFPDQIKDVISYGSSNTYSGLMLYEYSSNIQGSFLLVNNKYPKVLVTTERFSNYDGDGSQYELNENSDGHSSTGITTDSTFFTQGGEYTVKMSSISEHTYYIGSMKYMQFPPIDDCILDTSIYITPGFARAYLKESELPFTQIKLDENGYAVCCNAYIENHKLVLITVNSAHQINRKAYDIYPFISELIKPDSSLNDLQYRPSKNSITISVKDKDYWNNYWDIIRFDNREFVYDLDLANSKIHIRSTRGEFDIDFAIIEPYLKPEILQQFKK